MFHPTGFSLIADLRVWIRGFWLGLRSWVRQDWGRTCKLGLEEVEQGREGEKRGYKDVPVKDWEARIKGGRMGERRLGKP